MAINYSKACSMLSDKHLSEIRDLVGHFEARKVRAAERLATIEGKNWYFAVLGLTCDAEELTIVPFAKLQRVTEPPGEIELASALEDKRIFSAIGRYTHQIQYELSISREHFKNDQQAFNVAWWIISALRIRTLSEILIPAVANYSWSTIAAVTDGTCHAQLLEDVPQAQRFGALVQVQQADLDWVDSNLIKFAGLLEQPKFRLAVESLSTHHFSTSKRMMAATLWAGIEALFEIQSELRFRLAVVIASVLEPRGEARRKLYGMVKKLYDMRSKAVHGSPLAEAKIEEHILEVRELLSRLLCHFVEMGTVPSEDQVENLIFD
jgi:hypothetical protein